MLPNPKNSTADGTKFPKCVRAVVKFYISEAQTAVELNISRPTSPDYLLQRFFLQITGAYSTHSSWLSLTSIPGDVPILQKTPRYSTNITTLVALP